MRDFYQKTDISLEEVEQKYVPRTFPESRTKCHIAEHNGVPFGMIQCYKNLDHPESSSEIGVEDGTSVDLFIADDDLRRPRWNKMDPGGT